MLPGVVRLAQLWMLQPTALLSAPCRSKLLKY
jgi:hypothetical protein